MRGSTAAERPRNQSNPSDLQFPEKMSHITVSSMLSVLQLEAKCAFLL